MYLTPPRFNKTFFLPWSARFLIESRNATLLSPILTPPRRSRMVTSPACRSFRSSSAMAELDLKERQAGDVTILDLRGGVRIGDSSVALRDSIRNRADQGKKKVLLNLGGVKYIDSSGIGELIANYTTLKRSEEHTSELQPRGL